MPENLTSSGPGIAGTMTKISYRAVAGQTGLANKSPFVTDSMSKAGIRGGFRWAWVIWGAWVDSCVLPE